MKSFFYNTVSYTTILSLAFGILPVSSLAQATIPPTCATPGDCDDITPSFQGINVKTNGLIDNQGDLRLGEADGNGTNFIGIQAPASIASDVTLTLPNALGTNGQVLTTDASGNLTWTTPTTTTYSAGNGLNLTSTTFSLDVNSLTSDGLNNASDQVVVYDADTNSVRKISRSTFLSPVLGALVYQGSWNATTNTPTLSDATGTQGHYYIATVAGTRNLGSGNITFNVGDYAIHNGSRYELLENASAVPSVFGRTGPVTAQAGDYTATQITNTPAGSIAATTTQNAINELDTEKLANTLSAANLFVGNGSNIATGVPLSGDATLANNGALTIANSAISAGKIATNSIDGTKIALGSDAQGDTMYYNGTDWIRLPKGTAGQVLTMNAGATAPEWAAASAGSTTLAALTDVDVTGLTTGAILYYNGTDWIDIGIGTAGQALVVNPGATAPIWSNITGQVVDYGMLTIASGVTVPAAGNAIPLNNSAGNITATSNTITLSAGKTYKLSASVARINGSAGSAEITYQFRNTTTNTDLGSPGTLAQNTNLGWGGDAQAIITPLTTTNVQLWVKKNTNAGTFDSNSGTNAGTVIVQQLGSSATTVFTGANGTVAGTAGFIPAPAPTDNTKYLKGDGTWSTVSGATGYSSLDVSNLASGGSIGSAATTVDLHTNFNINQTTAGQTITIPSPTDTNATKGKLITINNVGSANFTLGGVTVPAGSYGSAFVWNGTVWNPINAASNVAAVYVNAIDTTGQSGATGTFGFAPGSIQSNNGFTLASNAFTATATGRYSVRFNAEISSASGNVESAFVRMLKNGSTYTTSPTYTIMEVDGHGSFNVPHLIDIVLDLNSGDNISFTWGGSGGAKGISQKTVSVDMISGNIPTSGGSSTLATLTDVDITGSATGAMLYYNGTDWIDISIGTAGQALVVNPGATAPEWSNITGQIVDYVRATQASNQNLATGNAVNYSANVVGNITNLGNGRFRLSAGKTYSLAAYWSPVDTSDDYGQIQWYNVTGAAFVGTVGLGGDPANINALGIPAKHIFTPSVTTDVEVRMTSDNATGSDFAKNWMEIIQLGSSATTVFTGANGTVAGTAGFIPAPAATDNTKFLKGDGTWADAGGASMVDYVSARLTSITSVGTNAAIPFVTQTGNIPNTSGVFTLTAGKTYRLTGGVTYAGQEGTATAGANHGFQWRDIGTNTLIGTPVGVISPASSDNAVMMPIAEAVFTPTTNTTVRLEKISGGALQLSATVGQGGGTWATIQQLGSSATTVFTGASSTVAGTAGFIPAPVAGQQNAILQGNGTWSANTTSSGYQDIGPLRIQWGSDTAISGDKTVTFPAAFADANITVTANPYHAATTGYLDTVITSAYSATSFNFAVIYTSGGTINYNSGQPIRWMAIGKKP